MDRSERIGMGASALVAGLVHVASLGMAFHADDFNLLRAVRDGGPFGIWSGRGQGFFRPLAAFSIWLDGRLYGLAPWGFHLTNVLLAMLAAALVALATRRLVPNAPAWTGTASGAIFALMPAHAEAVEWVACRGDGLATVLALGAVVAALGGGWRRAAVLTAIGFTAKESVLMVPAFLALLAFAGARTGRAAFATAGAAVLMLGLRGLVLGQLVGGYGGSIAPAALLRNLGLYFAKALLPTSFQELLLSPFRPGAEWMLSHAPFVALVLLLLLAVGTGALRGKTGPRGARLAGALFLGFFTLALPALPLGMSGYTWEGSRFVYLPSAALAILLGLGLSRLRPSVAAAFGVLLAGAYLGGDLRALSAWRVAGDRARDAVAALAPVNGRLILLSVPDSYRGAYILRSGLPAALALQGKGPDVLPLSSWMSESDDLPSVVPGGMTVAQGPLPLQPVSNPSERVAEFGAEKVWLGRYAIDAGPSGAVPRAVLIPGALLPVP